MTTSHSVERITKVKTCEVLTLAGIWKAHHTSEKRSSSFYTGCYSCRQDRHHHLMKVHVKGACFDVKYKPGDRLMDGLEGLKTINTKRQNIGI